MTPPTANFTAKEPPHEARMSAGNLIPEGSKLWLVLAAAALIALVLSAAALTAGVAFNWLIAAGAAPLLLLLSILPCLAMCALHLCTNKSAGGGCKDNRAEASGHQQRTADSSEQPGARDNRS